MTDPETDSELLDGEDLKELVAKLQEFLQPNTVLVIGLGLSASLGLPIMSEIANELNASLPPELEGDDLEVWRRVYAHLESGSGLESALKSESISDIMYSKIVRITGRCVLEKEAIAIQKLVESPGLSPFSRLLKFLSPGTRLINVVTSNYDRLIEVQAELADLGVDVGYPGACGAICNPNQSKRLFEYTVPEGRSHRKVMSPHVRVYKPHGSLDWVKVRHVVRRLLAVQVLDPVIIAPGQNKYQAGYAEQFAIQREGAERALRNAQRFIAIGYGFNDDQLEQSWCPGHFCEKPLLILTKALTPNTLEVLEKSKQTIAICEAVGGPGLSRVLKSGEREARTAQSLWELDGFMNMVE